MPEGSQGSPAQPVAWYTLPVDEAFVIRDVAK